MTDWIGLTQPHDYVVLAGQRSPGVCTVSGVKTIRDYDERRGIGLTGGRLVYRGTKLRRPMLTIKLYTVEDWNAWNAWMPLVQRPPDGARPHALDIEHPLLEANGITSVVIEEDVAVEQTSEDGEWTVIIKMIEQRPPRPALVGIDGSNQDTLDPLDLEIERNSAEIARLTAEGLGEEALVEDAP